MTIQSLLVRVPLILWICVSLTGPCRSQTSNDGKKTRNETTANPEFALASKGSSASVPAPKASIHNDTFIISADDVLAVNVWKEPEISRTVTVRSDGKISLPLVGELQASAKTPKQVEDDIGHKLSDFITEPTVTVIVQEARSRRFNVLGQVGHPGSYPITEAVTVLEAIAVAGGFRDFAKQKSIYVLRNNTDGSQSKIPFNYKEVITGKHLEQNIKLQPHDTVVVP
jgi:polysaccharide export outer membrane protein